MPTPTGSGAVSFVSLTGNNYVDSLLWTTKWGGAAGTSASVTYSFPGFGSFWSTDPTIGYGPTIGSGEPWGLFFSPLNSTEQTATQSALQKWANVAAITFVQSQDDASVVGDIRFTWTDNNISGQAHAYAPTPNTPKGGDIWLNASLAGWGNFAPGSYGYNTLLHEVGHAIGLKHPFQAGAFNLSTLSPNDDVIHNTIMSYSEYVGAPAGVVWTFSPTTPMPLDIKAAQYLYGPNNSYHAGNDVYTYFQGQDYFETIWDAGGTDTIVYSGSDHAEIDLRPGAWSNLGNTLYPSNSSTSGIYSDYTVAIYETVTIENATGGNGADLIYGNDVGNSLQGSDGDDTIYGFAGNDEIAGGSGNDYLEGGAGNDRFDWDGSSRSGADTFIGGLGDDAYVISGNDQVVEASGEGTDLIWADTNFSIESIANVENLFLFGSNPVSATGNGLVNSIVGNSSANVLDGRTGADVLAGLAGDDTYVVDDIGDVVTENAFEGADEVRSTANYILGAHLENLTLLGDVNRDGTGNDMDNVLTGNAGVNVLNGGLGNDVIDGGSGNDTLLGAAGGDTLRGGSGRDLLDGGTGDDSLSGGPGFDTASFGLSRSAYGIERVAGSVVMTSVDGTSTLSSVEKVQFGDGSTKQLISLARASGADFNGDGRDDLLWRHDGGQAAVWLMDGATMTGSGFAGSQVPMDWLLV